MQTVPSCRLFHLVPQRPNSVLFLAQYEVHNGPYLPFTFKLAENPSTGRCRVMVDIQASTRVSVVLVTKASGVINSKMGDAYARPGDSQA